MDKRMRAMSLLFLLFVLSDFVLGYLRERSIPAGIISIFGGLLSTAFYLLLYWWGTRRDSNKHSTVLEQLSAGELRHIKTESDYISATVKSTQGLLKPEDMERLKA